MKRLKRASKAAVSLWLSAVMTVLPAAGGMISPAYGMELTDNTGVTDTGSFDGYEAAAGGSAEAGGAGSEVEAGPEQGAAGGQEQGQEAGEQDGSGQEVGSKDEAGQEQGAPDGSEQNQGHEDGSGQEQESQDGSGQNQGSQGSDGQEQGAPNGSGQNQENQNGGSQNQGSQGNSGAEETLPEETQPEETLPDQSPSGAIRPDETLPEETNPEESAPDESQAGVIRPDETLPEETSSEETSAEETQPVESIPATQAPETTVAESTLNPELIPPETPAQKRMSQEDMTLTETVDGVRITVEAEAGILPEDTELAVQRIKSAGDLEKIQDAVSRAREDQETEGRGQQIYAFDISLYSGEELIEPEDEVIIRVERLEALAETENVKADLFHLDEQLEEAEQLEASVDGGAVVAPVSHFSPFALMVATAATADGYREAGTDVTVAKALEDLNEDEIARAGGEVTICLTGDTQDEAEVFIPRDKGIKHITITGVDGADYKIGKGSNGATLFANGVPLLLEHGQLANLYGGGKNIKLDRTDITITGGEFLGDPGGLDLVIVGGSMATVAGADVSVTDSCNITIEDNTTLEIGSIYAGSVLDGKDSKAEIGSTNLTVRDSSVLICMGCGGCFLWDGADNALADVGETHINIENSELQVGYFDFSFSLFGGNIGNDEVANQKLICGTTNISVTDSSIGVFLYGGGELFGGQYCSYDKGTPEIRLEKSVIRLENSQVNGVFGGGYYEDNCLAQTGSSEIYADNCQFEYSSAVEEDCSVIYSGDLYQTDRDYGGTPQMDCAEITLAGGITEGVLIRAEGVNQNNQTKVELPIYPSESHLTLDQSIRSQVGSLDLDSSWTDATVLFDNGSTTVITEYADYADLIAQIQGAEPLPDPVEEPGKVEQKPEPEQVETPAAPEGSAIAPEELEAKKNAAVEDVIQAIADTAANSTVPSLNAAIESLEGVKPGDLVSTYLKIDILDIKVNAEAKDGEVAVTPQRLILDVTPVMKVIPGGTGEPQTQTIGNDQLSGSRIEFLVGVPDSVTASRALVIHHASGGDESYEAAVERGAGGKFLRLYANGFSAFEIEFLADQEPDVPDPGPQPQPKPAGGSHDSDDSTTVQGRWVQDAKGWWYQYNNGTWPREQWAYLTYGDKYSWYFFDEDGYMKDGWVFWNGSWYYLHRNSDGTRGHMYVGWQQIEGKWYYFETDPGKNQGALYVNCKAPGGYTVGPDGSWTGETD